MTTVVPALMSCSGPCSVNSVMNEGIGLKHVSNLEGCACQIER